MRVPPFPTGEGRPKSSDDERAPALSAKDKAFVRGLVLHEDEDIIVFNKPSGLAVQGGSKTERHLDGILAAFAVNGNKPRLVHRLDRDTSGVMIVGRTAAAAAHLAQAFRQRTTRKLYWALTHGVPAPREGRIEAALKKQAAAGGRERMRVADAEDDDAQMAVTRFTTIDHAATEIGFLALMPVTGRTHQIRAHCALIRCPIIGDPKYGGKSAHVRGLLDARLHLHARALRITHPKGEVMTFIAPTPPHLQKAFEIFGIREPNARDPFTIFPEKKEKVT
ncbi:MAG TPA: RluA family pseudouridine synthase [Alphaproteobacteria bacterium]|nr:RluA family pseudouridine synthase [Alphaproteobacteria bacterium]